MTAVFDACTLINLLLSVSDTKYVMFMERAFDNVVIVEKVYSEITANMSENEVDDEFKEEYERTIFTYLNRFISYENDPDAVDHVKDILKYKKDNGELLSVSHALHVSRYGNKNSENDFLLKVHFITDDEPAFDEFSGFYEFNFIGRIFSSIDFLVICCLKGLISRGEVLSYCNSLKRFYSRPVALLIKDLKYLVEKDESIPIKAQIVINEMIGLLNDLNEGTNQQLSLLLERPDAKSLISNYKFLSQRISDVLNSNNRVKIPFINNKQKSLEKIWLFNYAD